MGREIKLIDPKQARTNLASHIEKVERRLVAVKEVIEALRSEEGKNIDRHLLNRLKKKLPDLNLDLRSPYGWYSLTGGRDGFTFDMNIGYSSHSKTLQMSSVIHHNQSYLLDEGRLVKYREELVDVEDRVLRYNQAAVELLAAQLALGEGRSAITENDSVLVFDLNNHLIQG